MFVRFFGSTFVSLMVDEAFTFATVIGNVARILHAIVNAEKQIPRKMIALWRLYASASYSKGFAEFVT